MLTISDTLTADVHALAYGGDGVARCDGRVIFIPESAPGDRLRVRVTQVKKRYARAACLDLITPSPQRMAPCCRVIDPDSGEPVRVPGCCYDHLAYPAEVAAKQQQLEGLLRRLPSADSLHYEAPFHAPLPLHYRNKITLHAEHRPDGTCVGYRREASHRVLPLSTCPLACEAINALLAELPAQDGFRDLRDGDAVVLRHTPHDGACWWRAGHISPDAPPLTEASPAGPLQVARDAFFQVNPPVADALVRTVQTWFRADRAAPDILDLYCGVGVFGFALLQAGGTCLTGVESGCSAIRDAQRNARALGLEADFRCASLGRDAVDFATLIRTPSQTTVLIDPPRDGMAPGLARAIATCRARRIFYVSCDPATLARDLAVLLPGGYRIARVKLFDMFPRTAHFESLVELIRSEAQG
jgi:23S rRNA (uracil1939-C5)-methyltransferase